MVKTQQIWTIRAFPFSVPQRSCREWATAILCARTADPCAPFVWEELKRHLRTCEACQEVYANYPVIEALIGELFVYLSDDARAALLEVRPTVAPDEIPAAPEVPITTAFAQLWHAWQVAQGQNRLVPGVAVRRFRPAVWAHTKLLVPSRLVLCKLVQFLGSCGQTGQAILWMAGRMCRQMIASWCRSVRDLGPVLI